MSLRRSPSSFLGFFGTATLVGGTLAAIAPGCLTDPDQCTIILSRNTPGGTLGFLTAPVANRGAAATTFTITSTNGADTSTVNWLAIPKNIGLAGSTTIVNNASLRRGPSGLNVITGRSAAMVAGTIQVTGLSFGAQAKVFVMAANVAGTTGKLFVATADVNAAQGSFFINSNSATDTSTVDYVVIDQPLRFSPSGVPFSQSKGAMSAGAQTFTRMNPFNGATADLPFQAILASVITSGTPGNLSAPTANRVNGNFDINSTASETSLIEVAAF